MEWRSRVKLTLSLKDRSARVSSLCPKRHHPGTNKLLFLQSVTAFLFEHSNQVQRDKKMFAFQAKGWSRVCRYDQSRWGVQIWERGRRLLLQRVCVLYWDLQQLHLWSSGRCSFWSHKTKVRRVHAFFGHFEKYFCLGLVLGNFMLKVADVQFVTVIVSAHTSLSFVDELSTFGRWLDGGTPIRNKEFTYVHSELALDLVFIQAVPAVWYES